MAHGEEPGRQRVLAHKERARPVSGVARRGQRSRDVQRALHRVEGVDATCEHRRFDDDPACLRPPLRMTRHANLVLSGNDVRDLHAVLGQRAGLVDAQHGGRAERLDRRHATSEDAAAGDPPGAEREEHGQHDRELLWQDGHRHRDACEQPFFPLLRRAAACRGVEHDDDQAGCESDNCEIAHHPAGLNLQRGRVRRNEPECHADAAEFGAHAGRYDLAQPLAGRDERPREQAWKTVAAGTLQLRGHSRRARPHRGGLAGQQ